MDPNIILGGITPNLLGTLQASNEAAAQQNGFQRQNALAQLYQTQGAGIMNGEQGALNALAGFDPQAALGIQDSRQVMDSRSLGMDQTRQNMAFSAEEMQMKRDQVRKEASDALIAQQGKIDAATLEAERAKLEKGLAMGSQAQTPEQWDQAMQMVGQEDYVGQFENRHMIMAGAMGLKDALDTFKPDAPPNASDRFKVVGSQLVDLSAEGGPAAVLTSPGQTETIYGPDGKPIMTRGPAPTGKPLTEGQSKDVGFATRARAALTTLEPIADSLTARGDTMLNSPLIPLGLGREYQSENFQVANNAGQNLLLAILRKDTGAAVTPTEEKTYGDVFLPRPGDSGPLLEQKAQARELAVAGLEQGMTADAILAQGRAIMQATGEKKPPSAGAGAQMSDDEYLKSLGLE